MQPKSCFENAQLFGAIGGSANRPNTVTGAPDMSIQPTSGGQAMGAAAHGDLGHQAQMDGDEPMRGIAAAMLAPALGSSPKSPSL